MKYAFNPDQHKQQLIPLLIEIEQTTPWSEDRLLRLLKKYPRPSGEQFAKDQLIKAYRQFAGTNGLKPFSPALVQRLLMKPTRTISGVTPITVLTKPFPCPGKCIFCPNDIRMPKSYLSDEPGAQRAERNYFDPYLQTYNRLQALHNIGHVVDKAEIIVLGGTWSFYPESYQIWFIKECFRALNDFLENDDREQIKDRYAEMARILKEQQQHGISDNPDTNKSALASRKITGEAIDKSYNQVISEVYVAPERKAGFDSYQSASWEDLEAEQLRNETASVRSVGLVIETRPDNISEEEVIRVRRLGCTKTQIGVQSLQDSVLDANNRGHTVAATRRAFRLLRQAGFKIHAHWMANLHGSTVDLDKQDYELLFSDPDFHPDELKIYPCSLLESAELMEYYKRGVWRPYTHRELLEVVTHTIQSTPEYARLTRVIRDIPSTDIVDGNKKTNFRQIAEQALLSRGIWSRDIRAREIRNRQFDPADVELRVETYETSVSTEHFIQLVVPADMVRDAKKRPQRPDEYLVGFLRLSLPSQPPFIEELQQRAIIREIHIYGQVQELGKSTRSKAQHRGFGSQLVDEARTLAAEGGYSALAVISAIGTKEYYRKLGFTDGKLYQHIDHTDRK